MKRKIIAFLLAGILALGSTQVAAAAEYEAPDIEVQVELDQYYVEPEEAYQASQGTDVHILDVRTFADYNETGHLKGSLWCPIFPLSDMSLIETMGSFAKKKLLGDQKPIYIVCQEGNVGAQRTREILYDAGVANERIFTVRAGITGLMKIEGALTTDRSSDNFDWISMEKTGAEAIEKLRAGTGYLLDVRMKEDYNALRVPGADSCPLFLKNAEMKPSLQTEMGTYVRENLMQDAKPVFILCYDGNKGSRTAVSVMNDMGMDLSRVFIIKDGIKDETIASSMSQLVMPQDAVSAAKNKTAHILDVRTFADYNETGHMKDSLWCPIFPLDDDTLTAGMKNFAKAKLSGDTKPVYIVDSTGDQGAPKAANVLVQAGIASSRIYTVAGGAEALKNINGAFTTIRYEDDFDWASMERTGKEALKKLADEEAYLLDVRTVSDFRQGYVKFSNNSPVYPLENPALQTALGNFAKSHYLGVQDKKPVYILSDSNENGAKTAVSVLNDMQVELSRIFIVKGRTEDGDIQKAFVKFPYSDIGESAWYAESVQKVLDLELMTGMNKTTFGPDEKLSRAQLATILWRMAGSPEVSYKEVFPDVADGEFYTKAVLWANEKAIIGGYENGSFGPADNITREQIVTMLYRYARAMDIDVSEKTELHFTDVGSVSSWALEPMKWAVSAGIMKGTADQLLNPVGNAVRAEAAALLSRFVDYTVINE